jgi:hypothetical protein
VKGEDGTLKPLVLPEHIKMFVSKDIYATEGRVDRVAIDREDDSPVNQGMHAKLTVVIEFEDSFFEQQLENIPGVPLTRKSALMSGGGGASGGGDEKKAEEEEDQNGEDEAAKGDKDLKIDDCFDVS